MIETRKSSFVVLKKTGNHLILYLDHHRFFEVLFVWILYKINFWSSNRTYKNWVAMILADLSQ